MVMMEVGDTTVGLAEIKELQILKLGMEYHIGFCESSLENKMDKTIDIKCGATEDNKCSSKIDHGKNGYGCSNQGHCVFKEEKGGK